MICLLYEFILVLIGNVLALIGSGLKLAFDNKQEPRRVAQTLVPAGCSRQLPEADVSCQHAELDV